jgi:DeoR family transcriptional regulator of aga operon
MDTMEKRRNEIVNFINEKGTITFSELKEKFTSVSEMTLRTDLKFLDAEKRILRIHGGAKSVQTLIESDDFLGKRFVQNVESKKIIAKKALSVLKENGTIYLDSGSTATTLAGMFPDTSRLIYTTGLTCATELSSLEKTSVMIPGGKLNRYSQSVYGFSAVKELERVNFDQAFMGVTGFHPSTGFACGMSDEAILKQTAIRQSEQVIVLMDSSKIGKKCSYTFCGFSDIDIIISDGNLPDDFLAKCAEAGVEVL